MDGREKLLEFILYAGFGGEVGLTGDGLGKLCFCLN